MLVGYPGHIDVFIAKFLGWLRSKPVVLDAFLSIYEAVTEDRKILGHHSFRAKLYKFIDRASCMAADIVLMDTQAHIKYYEDVIGVDRKRFLRVFVGAEEKYFLAKSPLFSKKPGEVLFFGSFLPLHGADVIVEAAGILREMSDIQFTMVGNGPELQRCKKIAQDCGARITWNTEWISYEQLAGLISHAGICLGIFSDGTKADRVIPCKIFNAVASGKPLITGDTTAAREAFKHGVNSFLVSPGNPHELAKSILTIYNDKILRDRIAVGGLCTFRSQFSSKVLGTKLIDQLKTRIHKNFG